ncbi:MAG: PhoH family protein [Pseudomonadales bacterium]|nr:PhoH family protein [Pseudomonadales bacterium]MCP5330896.1 PhoH family protein [Pseudomonadales bacterium]MCP5343276.1 PhoH family protein [Pseudomonadales bacterium]
MTTRTYTQRLVLEPDNTQRLANLCGRLNEHLHQIEQSLALKIQNRGNEFKLSGSRQAVLSAAQVLHKLYEATASGAGVDPDTVHLLLKEAAHEAPVASDTPRFDVEKSLLIKTPNVSVKPRGKHQQEYVQSIFRHDINFGIGPAGTGKTYLAVAAAVEALVQDRVQRLLLVRPAVEAGEKLGFLPGDLTQKVDPYLRPLYDALYEMLGVERVGRLIEKNIIEIAPLAYMRGRTLNKSFIILDESQNTTTSQMKMFLTRLGFGSTAVITGDVSQIDLPKGTRSGLVHVTQVLKDVEGIGFTWFDSRDVVRHTLVQRIVEAYDRYDQKTIAPLNGQEH